MEAKNKEMCESLIQWFQVLNLQSPHSNAVELSDGVAMAQALNQIAPDTFTDSWLSKIKFEVGSNWRLKVSNLKKVITSVMDYYTDVLNLALTDFPTPDVLKIAENHNLIELGRLLQLILGCAINCTRKQDYITQIMVLEESLQRNIMKALQELETIWQGSSPSTRTSLSITPSSFDGKTAIVQDERDVLAQRCHEAEQQVALLLDEKFSLQQEINKIQEELEKVQTGSGVIGDDGTSLGPAQPGSTRYTELRRQLDALKDELLQAETQRDDFKIKSTQQEKEIIGLQGKVEDLHKTTEELALLKDEVDALREASEKLKICEAQLATYKKKLEDHNDLKRQVKMLEERSADYLQQNVQQEENIKKHSTLKSQVELYKKEIEELHGKLDVEMMKSVKIEFELSNVGAKCTALQREKDSLLDERDALRETCDELRCNQITTGDASNAISREFISPSLKEKLERLEAENRALREGQGDQTVLSQFMDDSNQRMEKLREQLKVANQKILYYQNEDANAKAISGVGETNMFAQLKQSIELNEQKAAQIEEAHVHIAQHQSKISQLEAALAAREQELSAADARYRKSVEKAKEIIKSYDPKSLLTVESALPEKASGAGDGDPIETIRPSMGPVEERLMASAFYRLSLSCHRDAMDARLALLNGAGQSFLNRQRQPAARKPQISNPSYKK